MEAEGDILEEDLWNGALEVHRAIHSALAIDGLGLVGTHAWYKKERWRTARSLLAKSKVEEFEHKDEMRDPCSARGRD